MKFEYMVVETYGGNSGIKEVNNEKFDRRLMLVDYLNEVGRLGWELCVASHHDIYILKRLIS